MVQRCMSYQVGVGLNEFFYDIFIFLMTNEAYFLIIYHNYKNFNNCRVQVIMGVPHFVVVIVWDWKSPVLRQHWQSKDNINFVCVFSGCRGDSFRLNILKGNKGTCNYL